MTQVVSILGSTGSIGRQTLDVIDHLPIRVAALTANRDVARMEEQCRKYRPKLAVMADEQAAMDLKTRLADTEIQVEAGMEAICRAATLEETDTVCGSVMGVAGLQPTLQALQAGKRLALANKETLVCAGALVTRTAREHGAEILPVDSEHSAIFQCLMGCRDRGEVKRLILTASGGPFSGMKREQLQNKGLECIEAMWLYDLPLEKIDVVIHRQSVIHSLVEYCDGAVLAQLGVPDMRIPIQLALTYPNRMQSPAAPLDLLGCGDLTFQAPDNENFPCMLLALEAARRGGTACAVMSGANEVAVAHYLQGKIGFYDIPRLVLGAMDAVRPVPADTLEAILQADRAARDYVNSHL